LKIIYTYIFKEYPLATITSYLPITTTRYLPSSYMSMLVTIMALWHYFIFTTTRYLHFLDMRMRFESQSLIFDTCRSYQKFESSWTRGLHSDHLGIIHTYVFSSPKITHFTSFLPKRQKFSLPKNHAILPPFFRTDNFDTTRQSDTNTIRN
jgi:hypothetical protein